MRNGGGLAGLAMASIPLTVMQIVMTRRRILWRTALIWMFLEVAGGVCFFVATVAQIRHYRYQSMIDGIDGLALWAFGAGLISFLIGWFILAVIQTRVEKLKPGAFCPGCGYCLIGSTGRICPECGRVFTLEELGIGEEELEAERSLNGKFG